MNTTSTPAALPEWDLDCVVEALPEEVAATLLAFPQLFVAGGFIRAILAAEEVKDIDIFTTDLAVVERAVEFFIRQCSDWCRPIREHQTPCTIMVTGPGLTPVQFINNLAYPSPLSCIQQFDFTVCQAAVWCEDMVWRSLRLPEFTQDVAAKRLVYTSPMREEAPGGSLWRAFKYARKGYAITQTELAKLVVRLLEGLYPEEEPPEYDEDDGWEVHPEDPRRDIPEPEVVRGRFFIGRGGAY